jgi:hypothetical protein
MQTTTTMYVFSPSPFTHYQKTHSNIQTYQPTTTSFLSSSQHAVPTNHQPLQGCDNAACWCNKANLDLRIATMTRCASTSCTFANMNTATDISILSGIQVQYCVDRSHSPDGMALPSAASATPTESDSQSSVPTETTTGTGTGTGAGTESRTRATSGPGATGELVPPFVGIMNMKVEVCLFSLDSRT